MTDVELIIKGHVAPPKPARMVLFLQKIGELFENPTVDVGDETITVRWHMTKGSIVHASQMWYPMLASAFMAVDENVDPHDVISATFTEAP